MKRFYQNVNVVADGQGFAVTLDDKAVRTPGRHNLQMPTQALAEAVASEWREQGDEIQPLDMPLTQIANTAIDRTRPQRTAVIEQIAAYAETDLLCYRVSAPPDLAEAQAENWQALLNWAETTYQAHLQVTVDIAPLEQPRESLLAIYRAVAALEDFALTGLHVATAASGSVVIALALECEQIDSEKGFELALLDEIYQSQKWGDDDDARAHREELRLVLASATRFMVISRDTR